MKHITTRTLCFIATMLLLAGLTTLALFQLSRRPSSTVLASGSAPQSLEAARDALERAINAAVAKGNKKSIAALEAAFQDYLDVVSAREKEMLDRINELAPLLGPGGSSSGSDSGASPIGAQKPASDIEQIRAEYDKLNAKLDALRADFGSANIEVNKVLTLLGRSESISPAVACNVLIVNGASTTTEPNTTADATATLSNLVTQNGGTVTVTDQVPVPLIGFNAVYDIRFSNTSPISASDSAAYLAFLQAGGKLLLAGENRFFTTRNNSVISFVSTAGGGSLTFCPPTCGLCPATCTDSTLCSTPNTAANFSLPLPGGTTTSGSGTALLTVPGGCVAASVFRPGQLSNALAGTLITFFDINTFQSQFACGNDNLKEVCNIAAFFCSFNGGTCCTITCSNQFALSCAPTATVNFPPPCTSGACGTVTCSPASGSTFPVGTTTVTCSSSATGFSCSFTVTVSPGPRCLQDETNPGNVVFINANTGRYLFFCNGAFVASGTGTLNTKGCTGTIEHNKGDRRVLIEWDATANGGKGAGTAIIQVGPNNTRCQITDKDFTNNFHCQ